MGKDLVFITFLAASKAFDRLDQWLLFKKLINIGFICQSCVFSNTTIFVDN